MSILRRCRRLDTISVCVCILLYGVSVSVVFSSYSLHHCHNPLHNHISYANTSSTFLRAKTSRLCRPHHHHSPDFPHFLYSQVVCCLGIGRLAPIRSEKRPLSQPCHAPRASVAGCLLIVQHRLRLPFRLSLQTAMALSLIHI